MSSMQSLKVPKLKIVDHSQSLQPYLLTPPPLWEAAFGNYDDSLEARRGEAHSFGQVNHRWDRGGGNRVWGCFLRPPCCTFEAIKICQYSPKILCSI